MLEFGNDGNLVLSNAVAQSIWESGTSRFDPAAVVLKANGELAVCDWRGYPVWSTRTSGNPGAYLLLQRDGNLVLYSTTGAPLGRRAQPAGSASGLNLRLAEAHVVFGRFFAAALRNPVRCDGFKVGKGQPSSRQQ